MRMFSRGITRFDLAPFYFCCVVVLNMAASRLFSQVSDDDLIKFSEEHENENTRKRTVYDLSIFREYLSSIDEARQIKLLSFGELKNILLKFRVLTI